MARALTTPLAPVLGNSVPHTCCRGCFLVLSPGGAAVSSQGRQPLVVRVLSFSPGGAPVCRPSGAKKEKPPLRPSQGLAPLAINCRPSGAKDNPGNKRAEHCCLSTRERGESDKGSRLPLGPALMSSLLLLLAVQPLWGQASLPPAIRDVGFDQKLNAQVPLDLAFNDEAGRKVRLESAFTGKPVILVLAYFRCPRLCDEVLNGLVRCMLDMTLEVGKDFNVVTVSFDPRETPEMAAAKKQTYLQRYGREGAEAGWHFLTGEERAIQRLTDAVGFRYSYDRRTDQFAHAAGIVVLTPAGKVSRYFHDIRYSPRDLRLGLVEASQNRIGSLADTVLLYCFHYDPSEGKYGLVVMNLVRVGGVLTLLCVGGFLAVLWTRECRIRRKKAAMAG